MESQRYIQIIDVIVRPTLICCFFNFEDKGTQHKQKSTTAAPEATSVAPKAISTAHYVTTNARTSCSGRTRTGSNNGAAD